MTWRASSTGGRRIDFVLFPEGYVSASDQERAGSLTKLAEELGAPLLVGALDRTVDSTGRAWQVLLRFDPDGSRSRVYAKHSTAASRGLRAAGLGADLRAPDL